VLALAGQVPAGSSPVWSPDGTQIAFLRFRDPTASSVYIMNADGTGQHPVHPVGLQ
jgi:Tol biopolymer transport system component